MFKSSLALAVISCSIFGAINGYRGTTSRPVTLGPPPECTADCTKFPQVPVCVEWYPEQDRPDLPLYYEFPNNCTAYKEYCKSGLIPNVRGKGECVCAPFKSDCDNLNCDEDLPEGGHPICVERDNVRYSLKNACELTKAQCKGFKYTFVHHKPCKCEGRFSVQN